jgi:RHS repeat-associated protein
MLATINDKKLATDDGNGEVAWYEADVVTANDYYPFGMIMPGRKYAFDDTYRYGFNGQERSAEIDPNGNSMTAEFWQYDARLGRRWNVDPIIKESESPYLAYSANPVLLIDPDGSDTTKPGTAVREFKSIAKNPGFGPSMSWLYNWLPENNAGDKAAAIINGVGAAASEMIEGTGNLIKDPVGSVKTAMDMGHVGEPNSTQRAYYIQFAKEYAENTTTYGSTYANYFFWSKTATEIGSTVSPIIKAFKPPGTGYTPAMAAIDYAVLESMLPNKARFRVVSAMGSEKGITLGLNGGDFPSKIHPDLGLVAVSTEKWPVLQCAEPKALNKQLLLGVPKPSVSAATFSLKSGNHYRGSFIFSDARLAYGRIVQDVQFSSGKTVAPKAPCSNCNVLLKGTNDR